MRRSVLTVLLVAATACAPARSQPSATPSPTVSTTPASQAPSPSTGRPSATAIPLPTSAQVAAAANGVAWVFVNGDHLFRSTDRGDTWAERSLPQASLPNARIAFVGAQEGWILAAGSPATGCSGQAITLWATTDGAATWTRMTPSGIAGAQCKDSIAFADPQRGYIGAWDPNTQPQLYRTADGGKTWSSSGLPNPPAQRPDAIGDFGDVVLASAMGGSPPGRYTAFRSTDRGGTWRAVSTGPIAAMPIVFVTATRWVQVFLPDQSQETTDGGTSWHAFTTNYQQAAPVAPQIVFGDANTGYATVRGSLQRTTDGGAHWIALKTPGT